MAEAPTAVDPRECLGQRDRGMQFGVGEVFTFVRSVLQGAALRSTATVFETFVRPSLSRPSHRIGPAGDCGCCVAGCSNSRAPSRREAIGFGSLITQCKLGSRSAWSSWAFGSPICLPRERAWRGNIWSRYSSNRCPSPIRNWSVSSPTPRHNTPIQTPMGLYTRQKSG